jgi:hypothetical protein
VSLPALLGAALLAGLLAGFTGGWQAQGWRWEARDAERIQAESEAARLKSTALSRSAERNDRETTDKLRVAERAAAGARSDLERLRNAASRSDTADPAVAGCVDDGRLGRVLGLLAEGASLAEEGGRRVDRLAAEKAGLQRDAAGVRSVFLNEP